MCMPMNMSLKESPPSYISWWMWLCMRVMWCSFSYLYYIYEKPNLGSVKEPISCDLKRTYNHPHIPYLNNQSACWHCPVMYAQEDLSTTKISTYFNHHSFSWILSVRTMIMYLKFQSREVHKRKHPFTLNPHILNAAVSTFYSLYTS